MKKIIKKRGGLILALFILACFYIVLYKIYMPRINAFGCFDDCNNFMGGYFLLHGKRLFSEIFFNHNPLMAYLSFLVQLVTHPQNLYELILRHRQALLLFSFLCNLILLIRFGPPALAFALFYELTKFYLFGDRFLAEAFIVYPLVYLVGLVLFKLKNKQITLLDYLASGVLVWFIVFMREPYVPAALLVFMYLLWNKKNVQKSIISLGIFIVLSLTTILLHDLKEFYFNVVTVNLVLVSSGPYLKIFSYPIQIFFGGEWGYFRYLLVSFNTLFVISSLYLLSKKQWKVVFFTWVILGLANVRYVEPGKAFYSAFHLLCWYGIFLFISFTFVSYIHQYSKKVSSILMLGYLGILLFHIFSPLSFLQSKPDPHLELITNYGGPIQVGIVINSLSTPANTLFLDGFDDIIYWQAQRVSPYKYSWYTSLMPNYQKYTDERITMFRKSPPDFYYGSCPKEIYSIKLLPDFIKNDYVRLYSDNKPTCLWIKKTKLSSISAQQWTKAKENYYYLPNMVK